MSFHLSKNIQDINRAKSSKEVVVTTLKNFAFYHTHNRYLPTHFFLYKLSPLQLFFQTETNIYTTQQLLLQFISIKNQWPT